MKYICLKDLGTQKKYLITIALKNPTEEDMEFPPTATVVIGINEITKGEHGHSESEEEHAAATEAGQTE